MRLLQFPLIKIIPWFVLGIVCAYYFTFSLFLSIIALGIFLLLLGISFIKSLYTFDNKPYFGVNLSIVFFFIGIVTTQLNKENLKQNHFTHFLKPNPQKLKISVSEKLKSTTKYDRYLIKISQIDNYETFGKAILNLKKESSHNQIAIGSQILLYENLMPNQKPNNPNQFDYSQYLISKNIFGQIYSDSKRIKLLPEILKDHQYYVAAFRNTIIGNLKKTGFGNRELAVITALILGQQQEIAKDIIQDFQYAGAIHILSVSGLHVGFILLFISFLLKPIPNSTLGKSSKLALPLIGLWAFALIAGLAPSVVRSTVTFSFLAIGMFLNRESNKYHTVLVSMFLILLIEPMFLFDIGFQLSYAAVFSLLWIQPMISKIWQPKSKFANYFWSILTVSFAAQLGTLPLSIYYFHQFPGLFFVTNLVLIPILEFIIMPFGVILMTLAFINCIPIWFSESIEFSIKTMNLFINKIASIEGFILKDIPLTLGLMLVFYFILLQLSIWIQKRKFQNLALLLIGIIGLQLVYLYNDYKTKNNTELIVFNSIRKTLIGEKSENSFVVKTNDSLEDNSFEKNMLTTYATANFSTLKSIKNLPNTLYFNRTKILVIDSTSIWNRKLKPNVILLSHSPKVNLERIIKDSKPDIIIADASNYKNFVENWKQTCLKLNTPFHSTYEQGFYSIK